MLPDYEKLGVFYLGKRKDDGGLLLYDSSDLVTHAVCVGMTGSGKTGLCIGLLEEAALDGIPALVIDPKGDLANLLLTFPELRPQDFEPWVNPDEARNQGLDRAAFADKQAELWKRGLAASQEDGERIARLRAAADFTIYTPGSDAGRPVSVLKSFAAPDAATMNDREAVRDLISSTATSLLGLVGIAADPMKSREHVLLSNLLDFNWRAGKDPDLPGLIAQIQKPPTQKIGVLDLESFYPAKERFELAMALNNLLASPGSEAWLAGDPLDIGKFLWTSTGKPRVSIFSIAHLNDSERMFFVSLLLNQISSWVRTQPGTSSLRAILYMDEIFGYFPPVANPPSKQPLLTLLKQARAFGLGVVLATQNPVDLDYKGLANTGTWFLGRLQTERDKARVLEGLEGAGSNFDRGEMEKLLAGLGKRVFLMNNVHEKQPVLFETRWTLSYLRGPLARPEIQTLMQGSTPTEATQGETVGVRTATTAQAPRVAAAGPPVLPPGIPQYYFPVRGAAKKIVYGPVVVGAAKIQFLDDKLGVDIARDLVFTTAVADDAVGADWDASEEADCAIGDLEKTPEAGARFGELPPAGANSKNYAAWNKNFATWLFRVQKLNLMRSPSLNQSSMPGENERDFRVRLQHAAREQRDQIKASLQSKYGPKLEQLQRRKAQAEQRKAIEKEQSTAQILNTVVTAGAGILGAFLGRKTFSATNINKASQAVRAAGRAAKEYSDVGRADETVEMVDRQWQELNAQFEAEVAALDTKIDPTTEAFETITVRPKKTGISVQLVALGWKQT
ncbi:MAG: ATP-binding protein [Acidobacteriota bacterium]